MFIPVLTFGAVTRPCVELGIGILDTGLFRRPLPLAWYDNAVRVLACCSDMDVVIVTHIDAFLVVLEHGTQHE